MRKIVLLLISLVVAISSIHAGCHYSIWDEGYDANHEYPYWVLSGYYSWSDT